MADSILVRNIDGEVVSRIRDDAISHGISPGEYISRLVELHAWVERSARPPHNPDRREWSEQALEAARLKGAG